MSRSKMPSAVRKDAAAILGVLVDDTDFAEGKVLKVVGGKLVYADDLNIGVTDHNNLTNNGGDFSHDAIDAHIADSSLHFTMGSITLTASQVSDFDVEVSNNLDVAANTAARHSHANKALLDTYTQTEVDLADAVAKKHSHVNLALLETYTQTEVDLADAVAKKHSQNTDTSLDLGGANPITAATLVSHVNDSSIHYAQGAISITASQVSDFDTEVSNNTDVAANTAARHTHVNKALLDTYTQTEVDLADAVAKKHSHVNLALLETYTQTEVDLASAVSLKHTHANQAALDLVSGTNTGDQDLSGYVVGPASATDEAIARYDTTTGKLVQNSNIRITDAGILRSTIGQFTSDVVPSSTAIMFSDRATSGTLYNNSARHGIRLYENKDSAGNGLDISVQAGLFPTAHNLTFKTTFAGAFDSLDFAVTGILGQINFYSLASPTTAMGFNPGASSFFSNSTNIRFATGGGGTGMMSMDQLNKTIYPAPTGAGIGTSFDLGGDSTSTDTQIRRGQWENLFLYGSKNQGIKFRAYNGGSINYGHIINKSDFSMEYSSQIVSGASTAAHIIDTGLSQTVAGSKLLSVRNATVEKAYIDKDGTFSQAGSLKAARTSTAAAVTLATSDSIFYADSSLNAQTVSLPATPRDKQIFTVKVIDFTNGVTLSGNGNNIDGAATFVFLSVGEKMTVQYTSITGQWESL